jgi:adenylate cyclase
VSVHPQGFRIGFRASIITLFVSVVLFVGLSLVYFSFDRVTSIIRSAASSFIDKVAEHAGDRIDSQFKEVRDSVEILTSLPAIQEGRIDSPAIHALMAAMLRNNSALFSLYVGYADGNFLEIDFIDRASRAFRDKLDAPAETTFRLLTIQRATGGARTARTIFLSATLAPLGERSAPADYDPRDRPWYLDAYDVEAGVLTDPYIFFASGEPGYTLRIPVKRGQLGVVAGDILLNDADTLLRNQRLGRSGVAFLFDDADRIVAHPRMSALIGAQTQDGAAVTLPRLSAIYKTGIPEAARAWQAGKPPQQFFEGDDGRTYVVSFRSIETASSAHLHLAVLAPLDEFFATVLAQRQFLFLVALAFVAAALPPVFWLGSMLSRSLRAIAAETDRIQRFEPGDTAARPSIIQEIDDLGRSVFTMRRVVETFSSFVPKRLVQQLIKTGTPLGLGGVRREVTILFTDVENFTGLTERANPEQVMAYTSRYFAALSETIMSNKGTVDKFIGDAVMAIWNAPAEDADHVVNGCAAVLACRQANQELNLAFEREGWPHYRTRFGLHAGNVVVGNVGSADRMNYTVLGASVNLAARLEALNKTYGTSALVSEQIKLRADALFLFRSVDRINPKGFAEKFPVFELRCSRETAEDSERAFCEAWEEIYATLSATDYDRSLELLETFRHAYPGDGVARYHAETVKQKLGERSLSQPTQ